MGQGFKEIYREYCSQVRENGQGKIYTPGQTFLRAIALRSRSTRRLCFNQKFIACDPSLNTLSHTNTTPVEQEWITGSLSLKKYSKPKDSREVRNKGPGGTESLWHSYCKHKYSSAPSQININSHTNSLFTPVPISQWNMLFLTKDCKACQQEK